MVVDTSELSSRQLKRRAQKLSQMRARQAAENRISRLEQQCAAGKLPSAHLDEEVDRRLQLSRPHMSDLVLGRPACSRSKLLRNFAWHSTLTTEALQHATKRELQILQRGSTTAAARAFISWKIYCKCRCAHFEPPPPPPPQPRVIYCDEWESLLQARVHRDAVNDKIIFRWNLHARPFLPFFNDGLSCAGFGAWSCGEVHAQSGVTQLFGPDPACSVPVEYDPCDFEWQLGQADIEPGTADAPVCEDTAYDPELAAIQSQCLEFGWHFICRKLVASRHFAAKQAIFKGIFLLHWAAVACTTTRAHTLCNFDISGGVSGCADDDSIYECDPFTTLASRAPIHVCLSPKWASCGQAIQAMKGMLKRPCNLHSHIIGGIHIGRLLAFQSFAALRVGVNRVRRTSAAFVKFCSGCFSPLQTLTKCSGLRPVGVYCVFCHSLRARNANASCHAIYDAVMKSHRLAMWWCGQSMKLGFCLTVWRWFFLLLDGEFGPYMFLVIACALTLATGYHICSFLNAARKWIHGWYLEHYPPPQERQLDTIHVLPNGNFAVASVAFKPHAKTRK